MTPKKMFVVVLAHTKAVLAAVTTVGPAAPTLPDLVGTGLLIRTRVASSEATIVIPVEDLELKEVEYSDDVFRDPFTRAIDSSGTIVAPTNGMDQGSTQVVFSSQKVSIAVKATTGSPTLPLTKKFMIAIDVGEGSLPLKLCGEILAGNLSHDLISNDLPSPGHLILASVEGEGAMVLEVT